MAGTHRGERRGGIERIYRGASDAEMRRRAEADRAGFRALGYTLETTSFERRLGRRTLRAAYVVVTPVPDPASRRADLVARALMPPMATRTQS